MMKRVVAEFYITNAQGKEVDRFTFMADCYNNSEIFNKGHSLFNGYYPEGIVEWKSIRKEMEMTEMLGCKIVDVRSVH